MKVNKKEYIDLFEKIISLIKSNFSLFIIYPLIILMNFKVIKIFSDLGNLKLFIIIVMISQFEIGYIKEIIVNKKRLIFRDLFLLMFTSVLFVTTLIFFVIRHFKVAFNYNFIIVLLIGMALNEIKSFFDSKKHYDYGFLIKSFFLLAIPFLFLLKNDFYIFLILVLILTFLFLVLNFLIIKFSNYYSVPLNRNLFFFRFFIINFFSFFGGNIDRIAIYPNVSKLVFNQYVIFTESNSKLYSAFGFLNNLFFFGHLNLSKYLLIFIFILLNSCFLFIYYFFDLNYEYFIFCFNTLFSIFSQFFIFSFLKDIKHSSSSFFSIIGILVFLVSFFFIKTFFSVTLISVTIMLILKNICELMFLYFIKNRYK